MPTIVNRCNRVSVPGTLFDAKSCRAKNWRLPYGLRLDYAERMKCGRKTGTRSSFVTIVRICSRCSAVYYAYGDQRAQQLWNFLPGSGAAAAVQFTMEHSRGKHMDSLNWLN